MTVPITGRNAQCFTARHFIGVCERQKRNNYHLIGYCYYYYYYYYYYY